MGVLVHLTRLRRAAALSRNIWEGREVLTHSVSDLPRSDGGQDVSFSWSPPRERPFLAHAAPLPSVFRRLVPPC